ncbi:hypothetical protein BJX64DRAFT_174208 [Aspergillus heterothallicus]
MPPFTIKTTGQATLARPAERAILRITIHDSGPDAAAVSSAVVACSTKIKALLAPLSPQNKLGEALPSAAVTHWSIGGLATYSSVVHERQRTRAEKIDAGRVTRMHYASVEVEAKFRDFGVLAGVAGEVCGMALVSVEGVQWRLTERTKRELARKVRGLAGRDAQERAEDYAEAFGVRRVSVVEVVEEGGNWAGGGGVGVYSSRRAVQGRRASRGEGEGDEGLSFTPEEVEVQAEVTVKFVTE